MIINFTDFGTKGPYVGQLHYAIRNVNPAAQIIDLMHDVPVFNIAAAACLLEALSPPMSDGVFLSIVDPGVGSERRPVCLKADNRFFVGPDNGLFSAILNNSTHAEAFEIIWQPDSLSNSFHGRDLFAPMAARIDQGDLAGLEPIETDSLVRLAETKRKIIYVDHYGNCWTDVKEQDVSIDTVFEVQGTEIRFARVFSEAPDNQPFWYINSSGLVEFALNKGNVAKALNLSISASFTTL